MKNFKNIFIILLTLICVFNFKILYAHGQDTDDGYYIENMDVKAVANDKREFKITETIKVYFNEERHGIIRKIPKSTYLEDYKITDISVLGAPFVKEDSYDSDNDVKDVEIKIGDEDETIEGSKTYVISYTLKFYNDEQSEGDYIYLNVLGTQWDTSIKNFTSTITYPKDAKLETLNITDGEYGSKTNTLVDYNTNGNQINIKSKSEINAFCGVTVNARLNEGAFSNAPFRTYPYVVKNDILNGEITKEKKYLINRDYTVQVNENKTNHLYIWQSDSSDYINNVQVNNKDISFDTSENALVLPNKKGTYKFKVSYEIEPTLAGDVNFYLNNPDNQGRTESLKANISSPFNIDNYKVNFKQRGVNLGTKRYSSNKKDKTLTFENKNNINVGENICVTLNINNTLFSRPQPPIYYIFIGVSLIILIIIILLYFKNKDNNPPISAVEFYPPRNLNSAEVAYAYKQKCENQDITSLLFYWASKNHLKITINKDDSFKLTKLNEMNANNKKYEKLLFNEIFRKGRNNTVTDKQLKNASIDSFLTAQNDIENYFTKKRELNDKSSYKKARLIGLLPIISIILGFIYDGVLCHDVLLLVIASITSIIPLLVISCIYRKINKTKYAYKNRRKPIKWGIILSLIYIICNTIFTTFNNLPIYCNILLFIVPITGIILSGLVVTCSDYGKDIIGKINGFRNFIEVAEKDRLEALLEDDPYYFYNTLPYAQVLGVTKKWTEKFKDISMKQPSYYDTYYPMTDFYAINMLSHSMKNVTSTVSSSAYTPSSSYSDSGGFSGGGFSGGGGGGGGGSSW